MVARGRKIWCARRGVAAMRWHAPMQGRDPREIPGRSQGDPRERSEVPLCEVPMDKTGWARWLCVRCALCAAAVLLRGCLRRPRARAWVIVFLPQRASVNHERPGARSSDRVGTHLAHTSRRHRHDRRHASHIGHAARPSRVTRELERTISRRTKHHRTSLLRADPEQDRRRGASVTLSRSLMAISHSTPGRLT